MCLRSKYMSLSLVLLAVGLFSPCLSASEHDGINLSWHRYYQRWSHLTINSQSMADLLNNLQHHNFSLTRSQAERSLAYMGHNARLRRIVHELQIRKFEQGGNLTIASLGGPVTCGAGATVENVSDWFSQSVAAMQRSFPSVPIMGRRGCTRHTQLQVFDAAACAERMVGSGAGLVLVELAHTNMPPANYLHNDMLKFYEQLLRRLLSQPQSPAVVLIQLPHVGQTVLDKEGEGGAFYQTGEDMFGSLAQYYGIPWLSLRNALWVDAAARRAQLGQGWSSVMTPDLDVPNDTGHKMIADTLMWLVQKTAQDLLFMPFSEEEAAQATAKLPEPMQPGVVDNQYRMPCLLPKPGRKSKA